MKLVALLSLITFSVVSALAPRADSRMIAYLGNWQNCPSPQQYQNYDVVVVGFAVTYTWAADKNNCSPTCEISDPPICGNGANPGLISTLQGMGKKVILSFGGAGMGGSWEGDVNDCWETCFGRETQVVNQLVDLVNKHNFDGVDIDYEYYYEDNQYGRGFTQGAAAIKFLTEVTEGLRAQLPAGSTVVHAPMDIDLVQGTDYYNMIVSVSDSIDYLMPQYYNGVTRPAVDGFTQQRVGQMAAKDHYDDLVQEVFGGDATRVVFGFCIDDCSASGSNADAAKAAEVVREVNLAYPCNGGAFFWVVDDDTAGQWSSVVRAAVKEIENCSLTPAPSPSQPTTPEPTRQPVAAPAEPCCPEGFTGLLPFDECSTYYNCIDGAVAGLPIPCSPGLLFDESQQACNWANQVTECDVRDCAPTSAPTFAPTTAKPTPTPSAVPTRTPEPTNAPSPAPSRFPSPAPSTRPTWEPKRCCPPGYSGLRSWNDCEAYYSCAFGQISGLPVACALGLLFDETLQACNWADQVTDCTVDICVPTVAPTQYPTMSPSAAPTGEPTVPPQPTLLPVMPPTDPPTDQPTDAPTGQPVMAPVEIPTDPGTDGPTETPTISDPSPSVPPVTQPSPTVNESPSGFPSFSPTRSPVQTPVEEPPVIAPTESPTISDPTPSISPAPTVDERPTRFPTKPTFPPTRSPSLSPRTSSPTRIPTMAPQAPTNSPSSNTPEPTFKPTRFVSGGTTAPLATPEQTAFPTLIVSSGSMLQVSTLVVGAVAAAFLVVIIV